MYRRTVHLDEPVIQQMTVGDLIDALKRAAPDATVRFDFGYTHPSHIISWRGSYVEMSLDWGTESISVASLILELENTIGTTVEGYKGGDYEVRRDSPLWADSYGQSPGMAVVGLDNSRGYEAIINTWNMGY